MSFLISTTSGVNAGNLSYKTPVRAASNTHVNLTGGIANLSVFTGVTLQNTDRVLLKNQLDAAQNGIYLLQTNGITYSFVRASDANASIEMVPGLLVPVTEGQYAELIFQLATNAPIVIDTTPLNFISTAQNVLDQITIVPSRHLQSGVVTVLGSDCYIGCDSNATVTVQLPLANSVSPGKTLIIKDEVGFSNSNTITVQCLGLNSIDSQNSYQINASFEAIKLISNGVDKWFII